MPSLPKLQLNTRCLAFSFLMAWGYWPCFAAPSPEVIPQQEQEAGPSQDRRLLHCSDLLNLTHRTVNDWRQTALNGPVAIYESGQARDLINQLPTLRQRASELGLISVMILHPTAEDVALLRQNNGFIFGPVGITYDVPLLPMAERFLLPGATSDFSKYKNELKYAPQRLGLKVEPFVPLTEAIAKEYYENFYIPHLVDAKGHAGVDNMTPSYFADLETLRQRGHEFYYLELRANQTEADFLAQRPLERVAAAIVQVAAKEGFIKVHKFVGLRSTKELKKASLHAHDFEAVTNWALAHNAQNQDKPEAQIKLFRYGTDPASNYSDLAGLGLLGQKIRSLLSTSFVDGEWDGPQTRIWSILDVGHFDDALATFSFLPESHHPTPEVQLRTFGQIPVEAGIKAPRGVEKIHHPDWSAISPQEK